MSGKTENNLPEKKTKAFPSPHYYPKKKHYGYDDDDDLFTSDDDTDPVRLKWNFIFVVAQFSLWRKKRKINR